MLTTTKCRLKENLLGRWIIVHPELDELAWSGSRWVEIDMRGIGRAVQVSNFPSEDAVLKAALEYGFTTIGVKMG